MKFALRALALQVYQSIHPAQLIQQTATTQNARQTTLQLAENGQIDFMEQFFEANKKKEQTACIHATQSCLVNLADKLQNYMAVTNQMPLPKTAKEDCIAYYKILEEAFIELLGFLQTNFHQYFNMEQKLPDYYYVQTRQYFLQSVSALDKQMAQGISPQLI